MCTISQSIDNMGLQFFSKNFRTKLRGKFQNFQNTPRTHELLSRYSWFILYYSLLCVYSSFAIILKRKRKLVALLLLCYRCIVTTNVLWPFLMVPWVGLKCVVVVFPDHTHLLFYNVEHSALSAKNVTLKRFF